MTFRVTIGCDPGATGALAFITDGKPWGFLNMPTVERKNGGSDVDAKHLTKMLREFRQMNQGAHFLAVIEEVHAMPSYGGPGQERRSMGASTAFRFGAGYGTMIGVIAALDIEDMRVTPRRWKQHFGLGRSPDDPKDVPVDKDRSRILCIERFPHLQPMLARKKDVGRADALLIALWAEETEQSAMLGAAA